MLDKIKSKITWAQYSAIVSVVTAIIIALKQFGITFIDPSQVEMLSVAIWTILMVLGIAAKLDDMHNNLPTTENQENKIKTKVFKVK